MLRQFYQFWRYLLTRFHQDGCLYRAAALAFTSLLSIVPLMAVCLSIFSVLPMFRDLAPRVQDFIFSHFVASSGRIIQTYIVGFVHQASKLSITGFVFLVIAAVLMMFTLEKTLNQIWRVRRQRHGIAAFLLYWAVLTISPLLVGASLALSSYLASLSFISAAAAHFGLHNLAVRVTPFILSTVAFTLFYAAIPNCRVRLRNAFVSAVFAAVLFELTKRGFVLYLSTVKTYQMLYGAFATVPIFLLWIYLVWIIILLGAQMSYALTFSAQYAHQHLFDPFTQAFRWLGHLHQAQHKGKGISLEALVRLDGIGCDIPPEEQLDYLIKGKLLMPVANGRYTLACDLSQLTIAEFCRAIPWRMPEPEQLCLRCDRWEAALTELVNQVQTSSGEVLEQGMVGLYDNNT